MGQAFRINVLVIPDCTPIVSVGVVDLLRKAAELPAMFPGLKPLRAITTRLVSTDESTAVRAASGVRIDCDATLADVGPCNMVVVPALDPDIEQKLARSGPAARYIERAFRRGADVVSACTGAFLLAEAGILDGRAATTHWAFQALFAARYPSVRLEPEAILVDQGRVVTAGGATSFLNLTLYLVERLLGQEVARAASRLFLVDQNKPSQAAYAALTTQKAHGDDAVLRAQSVIERHPARVPDLDTLARKVGLSRRSLTRRFTDATGNTPRDYVQRVRVEAAKRLLEEGTRSVAEVAEAVGYSDLPAFRKIFVRWVGLTPADYRTRYGRRAAPAWVGPDAA